MPKPDFKRVEKSIVEEYQMSNKPNSPISLNDSLEIMSSIAREEKPRLTVSSSLNHRDVISVKSECNNCGEFCKQLDSE